MALSGYYRSLKSAYKPYPTRLRTGDLHHTVIAALGFSSANGLILPTFRFNDVDLCGPLRGRLTVPSGPEGPLMGA